MVQTLMQEDNWPHGSLSYFQSNGRCRVPRKGVASCPSSHLTHVITKKEVANQLFQLHTTYMSIKLFFDYVDAFWVLKIYMWCIGAQNIPHANHDMNATIILKNLKEMLKNMKYRLEGRKLDWFNIHELVVNMFTHYYLV